MRDSDLEQRTPENEQEDSAPTQSAQQRLQELANPHQHELWFNISTYANLDENERAKHWGTLDHHRKTIQNFVDPAAATCLTLQIAMGLMSNMANVADSKCKPARPSDTPLKWTTNDDDDVTEFLGGANDSPEAIIKFLEGVLDRVTLNPAMQETQLRNLVFKAVSPRGDARKFLKSKGVGGTNDFVIIALGELERQYTTDTIADIRKALIYDYLPECTFPGITAVQYVRTFAERVRAYNATQPNYQASDGLGNKFLKMLLGRLNGHVVLSTRLRWPEPPAQAAQSLDQVLSLVEQYATRLRTTGQREQEGWIIPSKRTSPVEPQPQDNDGERPRPANRRAGRSVNAIYAIDQAESNGGDAFDRERMGDDVNRYLLHVNATRLNCGMDSDDPRVRCDDLKDSEVELLHKNGDLQPIVKRLIEAFVVRDSKHTRRPTWPKRLALPRRQCIYKPHCKDGNHYVFECPILLQHYKAGAVQVAQVRRKDGTYQDLDLRKHENWLDVFAEDANGGIKVKQA